ncbi:hypothetical protein [Sphingobacterium chuzhouense]|nr:hypothetical protein [Sphingobacterium chuzhouense]
MGGGFHGGKYRDATLDTYGAMAITLLTSNGEIAHGQPGTG